MNSLTWTVILLVSLGFLWSGFVFSKERFPQFLRDLLLTGWEALLLGFAVGPGGFGFVHADQLNQLDPFIALGLGWAGLIFGIQMSFTDLKKVETFFRFHVAGLSFLTGLGLFCVVMFFLYMFRSPLISELVSASLIVAAACAVSSPTALSLMAGETPKGKLSRLRPLLVISTLDLAPSLVVVGAVFCFFAAGHQAQFMPERGIALLFYSFVIAGLLAVMFLLIDRKRLSEEHNLVVLLGFIIFTSGISLYLGLSPLFTSFLAGLFLANALPGDDAVHGALHHTEKPFYVILLVLAGMWWTAEGPGVWITGLAVVLARMALKVYSLRFLEDYWGKEPRFTSLGGLALCSPGAMALAIGLNFLLAYEGEIPVFVFGVIVVSTIFSEALAPVLIRRSLEDAEEVRVEAEKSA